MFFYVLKKLSKMVTRHTRYEVINISLNNASLCCYFNCQEVNRKSHDNAKIDNVNNSNPCYI